MTFCTDCGNATEPSWRHCRSCGAALAAVPASAVTGDVGPVGADGRTHVGGTAPSGRGLAHVWPGVVPPPRTQTPFAPAATGPARGTARGLWLAASALFVAACALTVAAMFPAYYRGGSSLASSSVQVWYNVPFIAAAAVSAVLLALPRMRVAGTGFATASTLIAVPAYLSTVGALATGADAAAGAVLGLTGIAVAVAGTVAALIAARKKRMLRLSARGGAVGWAVAAAAVGVAFAVGDAMPWVQTTLHATSAGFTFKASGTATVHTQCCTLLQAHGWDLAGNVLLVVLAVLVPLFGACWAPTRAAVGALLGAALVLSAGMLDTLAELAGGVTTAGLHIPASEVAQGGLVVNEVGMLGLWLALVAVVLLALIAAARGLQALAR